MNMYVRSDLPTIYADMNVFRYVAYGEIVIEDPDRFRWVYSHVHLNEVARSGNMDVLNGMRQLKAIEICDVLDKKFKSVGNIILRGYIDPDERYQQHLKAIAGSKKSDDFLIEHMLRMFGSDNFKELSLTPEMLRDEISRLTSELNVTTRDEMLARAEAVSAEMQESIEKHLKERHPIEQTRLKMGLTSSARSDAARSDSPIDTIWTIIGPSMGRYPKESILWI